MYSRLPIIRTFKGNRKMFELSRVKLYRKCSEGNENCFELAGGSRVTGSRLYWSPTTIQKRSWFQASIFPLYTSTSIVFPGLTLESWFQRRRNLPSRGVRGELSVAISVTNCDLPPALISWGGFPPTPLFSESKARKFLFPWRHLAARWRMIRMTVCFRKSTILFAVAAVLLNYQFFSGVLHLWGAENLRRNRESGLTIGVNSPLWKITMAKTKVCESIWERKSASSMWWKAHVDGVRTSANTGISVKASSKKNAMELVVCLMTSMTMETIAN